jgi:UDP-2,3-diacylglucosamine pyrophosphatase LpxH
MRHTVAISDIHLCEVERTDGLWMRYRQAKFSPDDDLAAMLDAVRAKVLLLKDELCLVLNGDVFDFDAPRVVAGESVFHDLPRTAEHAVPAIVAILDDHPAFVAALGRVLADGHEVVFVSGNHDVLLTLPEVRAVVIQRLLQAAPGTAVEKIVFRGWFHVTPDGIVLEHGHQYDGYCAHRYPMVPFEPEGREIHPTMGSLTTRNLVSRMGFFNPHVDGSFMLSTLGYLGHWARYYLFSRHSLMFAYAKGAARTLAQLVQRRFPASRARRRENVLAAARETGAPIARVARHARLYDTPAEDRLRTVIREFWVDRVALLGLTVVLGLVFFLATHGPLMAGAALAPVLFVTYELSVPKPPLDAVWRRVQRAARRVARVHHARAVVLGHTHQPAGEWVDGVFYGNTGSWSPAFKDLECTVPMDEQRPVVWLISDGTRSSSSPLRGGLMRWQGGRFVEEEAAPVAATMETPKPPAQPVTEG